MVKRLRRHTVSFQHAWDGIVHTFRTQPNFQIHTIAALLAISAGFVLHINSAEWAVVIFVIGLVLVAEMINTSVEAVVDLLTSKYHLKAKVAKDVSAGMVLVSAFIAVVTGILVYLPHIKKLIYP